MVSGAGDIFAALSSFSKRKARRDISFRMTFDGGDFRLVILCDYVGFFADPVYYSLDLLDILFSSFVRFYFEALQLGRHIVNRFLVGEKAATLTSI